MLTITFFLLLLTLSSPIPSSTSHLHKRHHHHSLTDACSLTAHRSLCIRSLSSLSSPSARHPIKWWARAAVTATLSETEYVHACLKRAFNESGHAHAEAPVLSDCLECFEDAAAQLRDSQSELRRLGRGRGDFGWQMSDVETWVSAALTDQDTCQEELAEWRDPRVGRVVRERVLNVTYFTSNALAIINELAAEGGSA